MDVSQSVFRATASMAAVASAVTVLAGCATPVKPLALDASTQLHRIAVLDIQEPPKYGATNVYLEGVFLGGVVNMQRTDEFTAALRQMGFGLSGDMAQCLERRLAAAGFEVERVRAERKPMLTAVVSHGDTKADALLNVNVGGGYVSPFGVDDYKPSVLAIAELLDNRSGKEAQIYFQRFAYGHHAGAVASWTEIEALPGNRYGSYDALLRQSADAGEGLRKGATVICETIAREIAAARK